MEIYLSLNSQIKDIIVIYLFIYLFTHLSILCVMQGGQIRRAHWGVGKLHLSQEGGRNWLFQGAFFNHCFQVLALQNVNCQIC